MGLGKKKSSFLFIVYISKYYFEKENISYKHKYECSLCFYINIAMLVFYNKAQRASKMT